MASSERRYLRVPVGTSMFHAPKPQQYSQETKDFLKLIMEESRLTMLQRRALNEALKNGDPLPVHPPVAHGCNRTPIVTPPLEDTVQLPPRHRRSKEVILLSGAYERDRYMPKQPTGIFKASACMTVPHNERYAWRNRDGVDKAKQKQKLQDKMAYGKEMPASPKHKNRQPALKREKPEMDRFGELVKEVQERIEFLQDMTKLGQGRKYKEMINQEIACKLREMESLDTQRCQELKNMLSQ